MTAVPRVDLANLQCATSLGSGGQGRVTAVEGILINGQWPAALKEYSRHVVSSVNVAALEEIAGLPGVISQTDSDWLHENSAWPAILVESAQGICGFLMRRVPPEYYFDYHTQTRAMRQKPANMEYLLNNDQYISRSGLSVSDRDRIALLKNLAIVLSRLHSLGVAVGDVSPKNLLFRLIPTAACFLIDCDAMHVRGATVMRQIQTPDWEVPSDEPTATPAADSYKFALLAIRIFARDQSSMDWTVLRTLSPELGRLGEASMVGGPSRRPTVADWIPALTAVSNVVSATPTTSMPAQSWPHTAVPIPLITDTQGSQSRVAAPAPTAGPPRRGAGAKAFGATAAAVVLAVIVAVGLHAHGTHPAASAQNSSSAAAVGGTTSTQSSTTEQTAAQHLSALLTESSNDRSSIVNAVNDVTQCGPNLSQDPQVFQSAAASRQKLLSQLTSLPGSSTLPAQMMQALTRAWQVSEQADRDFAAWAQDESSQGCTANDTSDSNYQAATAPDDRATAYKTTFIRLWNPLAAQYELPTYQPGQL